MTPEERRRAITSLADTFEALSAMLAAGRNQLGALMLSEPSEVEAPLPTPEPKKFYNT